LLFFPLSISTNSDKISALLENGCNFSAGERKIVLPNDSGFSSVYTNDGEIIDKVFLRYAVRKVEIGRDQRVGEFEIIFGE
jgi:hypothetical protein